MWSCLPVTEQFWHACTYGGQADISSALLSIYESMQCWIELLHFPQQSAGFCSSFLCAALWSSRQAVISSMILRPFPAAFCPLLKQGAAVRRSKCRQQTNSFLLLLSSPLLGLTLCETADNTAGLDLPKAVAVPLVFPTPSRAAFSEPLGFGSVFLFAFKFYWWQKVTSHEVGWKGFRVDRLCPLTFAISWNKIWKHWESNGMGYSLVWNGLCAALSSSNAHFSRQFGARENKPTHRCYHSPEFETPKKNAVLAWVSHELWFMSPA